MSRIVALIGPTAVGKTDVAIELATRLDAEIVGCDSMQVYRRMAALAAQPTAEQRAVVAHHLIDCVEPSESFNVGQYRRLALEALGDIQRRGKTALIVGGTGLYLKALTNGLGGAPPADAIVRDRLWQTADAQGSEALHKRLQGVDPVAASKIHPNDPRRTVRALEVYELTGRPLSGSWRWADDGQGLPMMLIGLHRDRAELYERINRRVEHMIRDERVLEEVRALPDSGVALSRTARQVHGLRFLEAYLRGRQLLEEVIPQWQQQVRNYAKRQLTWFRAESRIQWLACEHEGSSRALIGRILAMVR